MEPEAIPRHIAALAKDLKVPTSQAGTHSLAIESGHVKAIKLNRTSVDIDLALYLAEAPEPRPGLPALTLSSRPLDGFQIPIAFTASLSEVAQDLAKNERLLRIDGGELLVNKIRILRPHGDALLVKVDAEQIDPGGHRFKKRGTFHILVQMGFHRPTQTIRVIDAKMPEAEDQLSFILNGQDWLRSDALAVGLVSGLDGISQAAAALAYLDVLSIAIEGDRQILNQTATQSMGEIAFSPAPVSYSDEQVTAYVIAEIRPVLSFSL